MSLTSKPLDIFATVYGPKFWQQHTLLAGALPHNVSYERRDTKTGPDAKAPTTLHPSATEAMRSRLVDHIETGKKKMGPGQLLVASTNVSRFNRSVAKDNPVPHALLLQSPKGARAATHLVKMLGKIEAADAVSAQHNVVHVQEASARMGTAGSAEALRDIVLDVFDADLSRLKTKYERLQTWSQGAVSFGEYAQARSLGPAPFKPEERADLRALRQQLQRATQRSQADLASFDELYQRAAASVMRFTSLSRGDDAANAALFPALAPNLVAGGTFTIRNPAEAGLFAGIFEVVLEGLEDVRLKHIGPRLAELTEAQTLLGAALRRQTGLPPQLKG